MENLPQKRSGYLVANNIKEARDVAEIIASTDFLPRSYKDREGKPKINEIIIAGNMGARHGWDMFQSIQAICVINNRPSIWGTYFWGLILSDPRFIKCKETWNTDVEGGQWVVEIWKKNSEFPVVGTFSLQDAATAGLLSDKNKSHTWGKYPKDMCLWRARGRAGNSGFSDAIQGFAMVEEQRDVVDVTYQAVKENKQIEQTPLERAKEDLTEKVNNHKKGKIQQNLKEMEEKEKSKDQACADATAKIDQESLGEETEETTEHFRARIKTNYDSLTKDNRMKAIAEFTGIEGQTKISVAKISEAYLPEFARILFELEKIQAENPGPEEEKTLSPALIVNIREKVKTAWLVIVDTNVKKEIKKHLDMDLAREGREPLAHIIIARMEVPDLLILHRIFKERGVYKKA